MDESTETAETTEAAIDLIDNLSMVALTPRDMPEQQAKLSAWCARKIESMEREVGHYVALQEEAVNGGFKWSTYAAGATRAAKRVDYYTKMKAAVDAGYLIVPNMPTITFAVRVKRGRPRRNESEYRRTAASATPDILPAGEGRYVDDMTFTKSLTVPGTDYQNKPIEKTRYFASAFDDDVDFPLQGVMPEVLRATAQAMALKLFDQLGVVQNSGGRDPIVVGQLLDPRGTSRLTTFFVAWWLDTASL